MFDTIVARALLPLICVNMRRRERAMLGLPAAMLA